jgi:hypothetical protein
VVASGREPDGRGATRRTTTDDQDVGGAHGAEARASIRARRRGCDPRAG